MIKVCHECNQFERSVVGVQISIEIRSSLLLEKIKSAKFNDDNTPLLNNDCQAYTFVPTFELYPKLETF